MAIENLNASGGSGFSNPTNASASDGSYATTTVKSTTCDFDIDNSAIVDGDTVNSITIRVEGSTTGSGGKDYLDVGLLIGGVLQGSLQRTPALSGTDTVYTFTDAVNWDSDWTDAQLDGMQVRVVSIQTGMGVSATWQVDHVEVEVDYTAGVADNPLHVTANTASLTLAKTNATIDLNVDSDTTATTQSLTLTKTNPTVTLAIDLDVNATAQSLSLSSTNATIDTNNYLDVTANTQSLFNNIPKHLWKT